MELEDDIVKDLRNECSARIWRDGRSTVKEVSDPVAPSPTGSHLPPILRLLRSGRIMQSE